MPPAMTDIKPPAPVRVECRYAMCISGEKAELECLQCYLVGYCSEECAMKDRNEHSEFCKQHRSRMCVDYDPKEDLDRFLSGLDRKAYLPPDGHANGQAPASRVGHPKLIATDTPASFSLDSTGRTLGTKVNILTEGVGDLHVFINSFLELPPGHSRKFIFQMKEAHETTVLRNLVILLMAFDGANFIRTAEAMVHYWYSAYLPPWVFHFLQGSVAQYLHTSKQRADRLHRESEQDEIVRISYKCCQDGNFAILTWLPKRVWTNSEHLKVFSSAFAPADYAAVQSRRYQNILSRRKKIEKELADPTKPPEWRTSKANFLETGLLLPISTSRSNYTCPNPSFFRSGSQCFDYGDDPLQTHEHFELAGSFNSAKNDRHGQLFFHVRERLVRFICKLKSYQGNLEIHMFTDEGAETIQVRDPDLRWPPVATPPSVSAASSWRTGMDQSEEKQPVLDEADSETSSSLFVKDNLDSGLSTPPDGNESLAEVEPLAGTESTNEGLGKQNRRLTKGQKKKAALARRKAANANAAAQKAEKLARSKQEALTSTANAKKAQPAGASSFQLESTETETATKRQLRAAHNFVSSRQEATDSATDSKADGEPKSVTGQPRHTHLTRATPYAAACSPRTPSTPQTCASIPTGAQKQHGISLSPDDNMSSPSIDTPPQSPSPADQGKDTPAFPAHEDLGSSQLSVAIEDVQLPSTATQGGEPGTEKTPLSDKQSHNATPCKGLAATMEPEKDPTSKPKCGHETPLALKELTDAVNDANAQFLTRWQNYVDADNAQVSILRNLVNEVDEKLENDPRMTPETWKLFKTARSEEKDLTTANPNEFDKLWNRAVRAWLDYCNNINDATCYAAVEDRKRKEKARKTKQRKEKKKRSREAQGNNSLDQAGESNETLAASDSLKQPTKIGNTVEQATQASEAFKDTTKAEDTSQQPSKSGDTPEQASQPSDGFKEATQTEGTSEQPSKSGNTPEQATQREDTSEQQSKTGNTSKQATQPSSSSKKSTEASKAAKKASKKGKASEIVSQNSKTVTQPTNTGELVKQVFQGSGSIKEASQASNEREKNSQQSHVFTKFRGKEVNITGRNIDPNAFEALPEGLQEEVLASSIEPEPEYEPESEPEKGWTTVQRKRDTGKGKEANSHWWPEPAKRTIWDKKPLAHQKEARDRGQDKEPMSGTKRMEAKALEQDASKVAASYKPSQPPQVSAWNIPRKPLEVAASSSPQATAWGKFTQPPQIAASNDTPTRDSEGCTLVVDTPSGDTQTLHHGPEQPQNPEQPGRSVTPKDGEPVGSQLSPLFSNAIIWASKALLALRQGSAAPPEPEEPPGPEEPLGSREHEYPEPEKPWNPARRTNSDPILSRSHMYWDGQLREPEESKQFLVPSKASSEGFEGNALPTNKVLEVPEQLQPTQQGPEKLHGLEQHGKIVVTGSVKSEGSSGCTLPSNTTFVASNKAQPARHGSELSQESGATFQGPISARPLAEFRPQRGEPCSSMQNPRRERVGFEQYVAGGRAVVRVFSNTSRSYPATPNCQDGNIEATTQADAATQTEATMQADAATQTEATMQADAATQTKATMLVKDTMQAHATTQKAARIQAESETQTEPTTSDHSLARNMHLTLRHLQQAVPKEGIPKKAWGHLGWLHAQNTHYAIQLAVDWGGKYTNGTTAPIRTGAAIRPGNSFEDIMDYEKCHYVTRAEEVGDVPVRPVPWGLGDWQEHMERIVENPRGIQETAHS